MAKKGKMPAAPNYAKLAEQQSQSELAAQREATRANRINQYTPWGSTTYGQDGGSFDEAGYNAAMANYNNTKQGNLARGTLPTRDQFTVQGTPWQKTTLDPRLQQQLDSQLNRGAETEKYINQTFGPRIKDAYSQEFNWKDAPAVRGIDLSKLHEIRDVDLSQLPDVWDADWTKANPETGGMAIDTVKNALMSRIAPDLLRNRQREEAQLIAQGVGRGAGEAWGQSQKILGRNETDASNQALLSGIGEYGNIRGGQMGWRNQKLGEGVGQFDRDSAERAQRYGELTDQYGRDITDRNRYLSEQKARRDLPLEEMMKLTEASGDVSLPKMPGFYEQGSGGGTKYGEAGQQQYGSAMDRYNAKQAQNANFWNSAATLGMGGAMMMSDIRLKENIKRIGTHPLGIGIYDFDYKWGEHSIGVMAQELVKVKPEAVITGDDGFMMVDYSMIEDCYAN